MDGHFLRKFGWGNKQTLQLQPEAKGVDVCAELRAFYDRHYRPENCKLVLMSPFSLQRMEDEALLAFGQWGKSSVSSFEKTKVEQKEMKEEQKENGLAMFAKVFGTTTISGTNNSTATSTNTNSCSNINPSTASVPSPTRVYRIVPMRRNYHWVTLAWVLPPTLRHYR